MKPVKIVYFTYLVPNKWYPIVTEQLDALKELELYEIAKKIYISVIADDCEFEKLKILLFEKYSKIEIINHYYENVYEYPGIKAIYDIAENDEILLYFHSKGMTSNAHDDRKKLFQITIKNFEQYLNEFEVNDQLDVACALPHKCGFAYFNFFWIHGSFVKNWVTQPVPSQCRYVWECWIGNQYSKKQNVITYSPYHGYNTVVSSDPHFMDVFH